MEKIEIADTVHHKPSNEWWVVARVTETPLSPAGWPPCCAKLADCELAKKATPEQREVMMARLRELPADDERHLAG